MDSFKIYTVLLACGFFLFILSPASAHAFTGLGASDKTFTPQNANTSCSCTVKNGTDLVQLDVLASKISGGTTCAGLSDAFTINNTNVFKECIYVAKFDTLHACVCKGYSFQMPSQNDCSTLSGYLTGQALIDEPCVWQTGEKPPSQEQTIPYKPIPFVPMIRIPTAPAFTTDQMQKPDAEGYVYVPFTGQYILGVYKYALLVGGLLAAALITFAGLQYITSAGNTSQTKNAMDWIGGAFIGLLILVASYVILYTINPDLTVFKSLPIKVIATVALDNTVEDKQGGYTGAKKPLSATTYDDMFQQFAACSGIDWRVYKVFSWHESGLNPTAVGGKKTASSATGLFQTYRSYCPKLLKNFHWDQYCDNPGITNPAVNTAMVSAGHFIRYPAIIKSMCPSANLDQQIFMLYFGLGNGGGGLKNAINAHGCDPQNWLSDTAIFKGGPPAYTAEIISLVKGQGVTNLFDTSNNGVCPPKSGKTPADFPSN